MNIAVYCSARTGLPEEYVAAARDFGRWIGQNHHTLVYGGLARGLMETVATAASESGAQVVGIVPESRKDWQHAANTVNLYCTSLHERKEMMEQQADAFVALPGGIGTLDETFSALATMIFFSETKPIAMLSLGGLYAPLGELMDNLVSNRLANTAATGRLKICPTLDELTAYLSR